MKVIILCGGQGLRMGSGQINTPKPMCDVNGRPLLWHIMNIYSTYGYNDFILPLGYDGAKIKEYFLYYPWRNVDMSINLRSNRYELLGTNEDWTITFINTGLDSMTGTRVKRVEHLITDDVFMLTYGDGLADVNVADLVAYHRAMGKVVTVTGVQRHSPYGAFDVADGVAKSFVEKPLLRGWANGGYFVCDRSLFAYLTSDGDCVLEEGPLRSLAEAGQMAVYEHHGFWIGVDSPKDLKEANERWPVVFPREEVGNP